MKVPDPRRGAIRGSFRSSFRFSFRFSLGLAAATMLLLTAATGQRAQAMSLINPAAVPSAKYASDGLTEVRDGRGHIGGGFRGGGGGGFRGGGIGGFRGGGAAIHGGGFRGGGAVFRGGGFRAGPAFHRGGGYRFAAPGIVRHHHFGPRRAYFHHRHHFRPRYYGYAPAYYPPRYFYPRRFCKVVWTYYGPRKICRYRPWHHHHWRIRHRLPVYW